MNRIIRIAAIGALATVVLAALSGCGGSEKYSEQYTVISESCGKAVAAGKAELAIDENIKIDKDIEGVIENKSTYTYITYEKGDVLNFEVKGEDSSSEHPYQMFIHEGTIYEYKDGEVTEYIGEEPDFSEYVSLGFALDDVKKISVEYGEKGTKLYTVTMNSSFVDGFDAKIGDGEYDCTDVTFVYQIDSLIRLKAISAEYTAKVTYGGETLDTVRTVAIQFADRTDK